MESENKTFLGTLKCPLFRGAPYWGSTKHRCPLFKVCVQKVFTVIVSM